jgi:tyrosyl-tRNA synthetase
MKTVAEQLALIQRGTEQIEPLAELQKKLERSVATGKPLGVKYGIDPTGFDVHLGHTVPLRKLRLFQELGHQAVLIIGDYTALVGDPSGRDQSRARLTPDQVEANAKDYLKQISKIIDIDKAKKHHNGDWFRRMTFLETMRLTGKITVQRLLERDDFHKRFRASPSVPIYLHECLYPLMQGQDSVEISADVELGGSEQLFNLMMGRRLQEDAGQEPQICITMPILIGLDGHQKMGKSLGNYIGVGESAKEQFGKTMSIPDELMRDWFTLLTDRQQDEITGLLAGHPNEAKKTLAADIVAFYHGMDAAGHARADFEKQFSKGQLPDEIAEVEIAAAMLAEGKLPAAKLLVSATLAASNNEARRKIGEGAASLGAEKRKIADPNELVAVESGMIVRLGRRIVRIKVI